MRAGLLDILSFRLQDLKITELVYNSILNKNQYVFMDKPTHKGSYIFRNKDFENLYIVNFFGLTHVQLELIRNKDNLLNGIIEISKKTTDFPYGYDLWVYIKEKIPYKEQIKDIYTKVLKRDIVKLYDKSIIEIIYNNIECKNIPSNILDDINLIKKKYNLFREDYYTYELKYIKREELTIIISGYVTIKEKTKKEKKERKKRYEKIHKKRYQKRNKMLCNSRNANKFSR